jgi:alkanesulfonate monooxygenase SsuD/methylene tetrahydromethanopterin reductase-like flavin-dependent oxidoreductase (luciferase family)
MSATGYPALAVVDDLRANALAGTPSEAQDRLGQLASAGVERVYLQFLDIDDLDHVRLAAEVLSQV